MSVMLLFCPRDGWQEGPNAIVVGNASHVAAGKVEARDHTIRRPSLYRPVNIVAGRRVIVLGLGKFPLHL